MTTTTMSTDLYRIAIDRQAALRHEAAQAHAYQPDNGRTGESAPADPWTAGIDPPPVGRRRILRLNNPRLGARTFAMTVPSPTMEDVATRVSSPQFIGRDAELAALNDAVERAAAGDASVVLIGGDAGIGKTRLISELHDRARQGGAMVLEGGCVSLGEGGGLPYAPFVEALRRLPAVLATGRFGDVDLEDLRTPATAELGRLMPEFGTPTAEDHGAFARPDWVQARIFEGLLALLRDLGERAPVVCILEDLHWADGSTRDLVAFLARNIRAERLVVVGTYRTDDLHRRHPLRPWLSEMERLPRVRRLELSPFGRDELGSQVEAILGHAPEPGLIEAIERRTEGNPFFIEELLAARADAGSPAARLPETLRDVLLSRVAALSEDCPACPRYRRSGRAIRGPGSPCRGRRGARVRPRGPSSRGTRGATPDQRPR